MVSAIAGAANLRRQTILAAIGRECSITSRVVVVEVDRLDAFARFIVEHVAAVDPRWNAQVGIADSDAIRVELTHPYSRGFIFDSRPHLASDEHSRLAWAARIIEDETFSWERALLADAPDPPANPQAVVGLRVQAESFAWSNIEARAVSGLLTDAGALTHEEYAWIRQRIGEDAPGSPGPHPTPGRWRWRTPTEPFGPRDARRLLDPPEHKGAAHTV